GVAMKLLLLLTLIALLTVGIRAVPLADAQAAPSITITKPAADGDTVADGDEFATTVLGNPWDMSLWDTSPSHDPSTPSGTLDVESTFNVNNATYSNGIWRGVSRNNIPQLLLLTRGYGQGVDPCCGGGIHWQNNDGYVNPLNADKYHFISLRMKL